MTKFTNASVWKQRQKRDVLFLWTYTLELNMCAKLRTCGSKQSTFPTKVRRDMWLVTVGVSVSFCLLQYGLVYRMYQPSPSNLKQSSANIRNNLNQTAMTPENYKSLHSHHASSPALKNDKFVVLDGLTCLCTDVGNYSLQNAWKVIILTHIAHTIQGCRSPQCQQLTPVDLQYSLAKKGINADLSMDEGSIKNSAYLYAVSEGARIVLDAKCNYPAIPDIDKVFQVGTNRLSGLFYNATTYFNPSGQDGFTLCTQNEANVSLRHFRNQSEQPTRENYRDLFIKDILSVDIRELILTDNVFCPRMLNLPQCKPGDNRLKYTEEMNSINSHAIFVSGSETFTTPGFGPVIYLENALMWLFVPPQISLFDQILFKSLVFHRLKMLSISHMGSYFNNDRDLQNTKNCRCPVNNKSAHTSEIRSKFFQTMKCLESYSPKLKNILDSFSVSIKIVYEVIQCIGLGNETIVTDAHRNWSYSLRHLGFLKTINRQLLSLEKNSYRIRLPIYSNFKSSHSHPEYTKSSTNHTSNSIDNMRNICPRTTLLESDASSLWHKARITDIALVIVLNIDSQIHTLPYTEFIHRPAFRYIVYCGANIVTFKQFASTHGFEHVTFIEKLSTWHFFYECITQVMKLRLPVKGYLRIGDDTLLNTWMMEDLPRHKIWMPGGTTKFRIEDGPPIYWVHWVRKYGREVVSKALSELIHFAFHYDDVDRLSSLNEVEKNLRSVAKRFVRNYSEHVGFDYVMKRAIDIFYVPETFKNDYVTLAEFFRERQAFVELVLPMMHLGMTSREESVYVNGSDLWREAREVPWNYFTDKKVYLHPFKSMAHLKLVKGRDFFCSTYLKLYEEWLNKI